VWAGVDVGGRRKGFHVALVDSDRLRAGPARLATVSETVRWLKWRSPRLVAVDSPCVPAPDGFRSRPEERELARSICRIRYTPEAARLARNRYYEWIVRGLALYAALEEAGLPAIECFPTASFTRWAGPRGTRTRSAWTREALAQAKLGGIPSPLGQDGRDAIAAALTARAHERGLTESFGPIVVPR
jgi:predicted nuclease with RNAse H fold